MILVHYVINPASCDLEVVLGTSVKNVKLGTAQTIDEKGFGKLSTCVKVLLLVSLENNLVKTSRYC